jgi:hypothetical protein
LRVADVVSGVSLVFVAFFGLSGVRANFLVIFLQSSKIFTGLRELTLSDV